MTSGSLRNVAAVSTFFLDVSASRWPGSQRFSFSRVSVFSYSQTAIKTLSGSVNDSRIVKECRNCLDFLSGRFSVSLAWFPGHSNKSDTELLNGFSFNRVSVFSYSQTTIKTLSGFVNDSRIVKKCRNCLDFLSGRFSVSLA